MAGLLGALLYSAQALSAQSAGLRTAGGNLANVNTPGYARQRVALSNQGSSGAGANTESLGVQVTGVQSLRDRYLDAQVVGQNSATSMLQAKYDAMGRTQAALGETIDRAGGAGSIGGGSTSSSGINGALTTFFNGFQALSADPSSTAQKQVLMQNAGSLATTINAADANLASEQSAETARITGDVSDANGLLSDIAGLNSQIAAAEGANPGSAIDLRDQRQGKLEALAQKVNIQVSAAPGYPGQVQVSMLNASGASVTLVDKANVTAPLSFDGTSVLAGSPAAALAVTGGSVAGELQARDGVIAGLRGSLKTLAGQLSSAVNAAYNPGGTSANFFAATPPAGQLLAIDPATTANTVHAGSTGDSGANDLALAVSHVGAQTFSAAGGDPITGTLGGYYSGVVSNFGAQIAGASSQIADQGLVSAQIGNQRDSVSGVSIDEETTNLMQYQRAFQASSRVISVIDSMFDDVLSMVH